MINYVDKGEEGNCMVSHVSVYQSLTRRKDVDTKTRKQKCYLFIVQNFYFEKQKAFNQTLHGAYFKCLTFFTFFQAAIVL